LRSGRSGGSQRRPGNGPQVSPAGVGVCDWRTLAAGRDVRLRAMSECHCFPFGQPVLPRPPSATGPRAVFVLGAYPSGFHVAWWLPGSEDRRTSDAKALIVDNEPEVFWDGAGAADLFERWRRDVGFDDHSWGRVALPGAGHNGPSGQWLGDKILVPLGYRRTGCWITDCLDTARLNPGQRRQIREQGSVVL
jgi:hypothetical protein